MKLAWSLSKKENVSTGDGGATSYRLDVRQQFWRLGVGLKWYVMLPDPLSRAAVKQTTRNL